MQLVTVSRYIKQNCQTKEKNRQIYSGRNVIDRTNRQKFNKYATQNLTNTTNQMNLVDLNRTPVPKNGNQ